MQVIWGQLSHLTSPNIGKPKGEYWNYSLCNINYIIQTQTHVILASYTTVISPHLIFAFLTLCDVTDTSWAIRVLLCNQSFSSITFDQSEIDSRARYHSPLWWHWSPKSTAMWLTPYSSTHDLKGFGLTLTSLGQPSFGHLPIQKYIIQRSLVI